MSDHYSLSLYDLHRLEEEVFPNFLEPNLTRISTWLVDVMCVDSAALRAHTRKCRNLGDIDLLFSTSDPGSLAAKIKAEIQGEIITAVPNGFYRAVYHLSGGDPFLSSTVFMLDFHINRIYMNNEPTNWLPDSSFQQIRWTRVPNASKTHDVLLPVPDVLQLFFLKTQRGLGNDDIDVIAILLAGVFDIKALPELTVQQVGNLRRLLSRLEQRYHAYCTYYFQPESGPEYDRVLCALEHLLGYRHSPPTQVLDLDWTARLEKQRAEATKQLEAKRYSDASRQFHSVALEVIDIDPVLHHQMRLAAAVSASAGKLGERPRAISIMLKEIDEAIRKTQKLDDRMSILLKGMKQYYSILGEIAKRNTQAVEELYFKNRRSCAGVQSAFDILSCISAALYVLKTSMRRKPAAEVLALAEGMEECITKCLNEKPNNSLVEEVLEVVVVCVVEVHTALREQEKRTRPLCIKKANELRRHHAALESIHNLVSAIAPDYRRPVMEFKIGKVDQFNAVETLQGDFSPILEASIEDYYQMFAVAEDSLKSDAEAVVPDGVMNTLSELIETKRTSETELKLKFPFLSLAWKRYRERVRK